MCGLNRQQQGTQSCAISSPSQFFSALSLLLLPTIIGPIRRARRVTMNGGSRSPRRRSITTPKGARRCPSNRGRRLFEPESSRSHLIVMGKRGGYGHAGRNLYAPTGSDGAGEQGIEHVSVRARHLAGDASDADLRSKYSLGLNGERTGRKKPFTRGSPLPSDHARLPQL